LAVGHTGGANAPAIEVFAECYVKAGPEHDYFYFMPDEARLK